MVVLVGACTYSGSTRLQINICSVSLFFTFLIACNVLLVRHKDHCRKIHMHDRYVVNFIAWCMSLILLAVKQLKIMKCEMCGCYASRNAWMLRLWNFNWHVIDDVTICFSLFSLLFILQILVPNASFTGHLAGILVGLAFTKTPLKAVLDWPFSGNSCSKLVVWGHLLAAFIQCFSSAYLLVSKSFLTLMK